MPTYNNKIVLGDEPLIDLTSDTVTPEKVLSGETFHDRSGAPQTGSLTTHTYSAGDGIVIENDEISTDNMPAADMAEIVNPLPSVMSRFPVYSEDEQMIAYWEEIVDGVRCRKPIYEKRYDITSPTASASAVVVATYDPSFSIINMFGMIGGYPLSGYQGANYYVATLATGGNIYIEQKNVAAGVPGYIFICYTKSTDSWIPV